MSHVDHWYIRYPDGRVLRAASTEAVRRRLARGRIPSASLVRRSPEDEWVSLAWAPEFADLVSLPPARNGSRRAGAGHERAAGEPADNHPTTVASRLDANRLELLGVRGFFLELLAALDSTLVRRKLVAAFLAGLVLGLLLALSRSPQLVAAGPGTAGRWVLIGGCWLVVTVLGALLTRMTYVEVSHLRPARWRDGLAGFGSLALRLLVSQLVVAGSVVGLIVLLRWLPDVYAGPGQIVAQVETVLAVLFEVLLWPVLAGTLLLAPVLVVENGSVAQTLRDWYALLRRHFARVLLYEALAVAQGALVVLPFAFPVLAVGLFGPPGDARLFLAASFTRNLLLGLVLTPLGAYLIVANVFIYLNLRYEFRSGER